MSGILEIPEVRRRVSPLTVKEYHRLGEFNDHRRRTELIRGFVIQKMSKSPLHRRICSLLYKLLLAHLPEGYSVGKEEPLTFRDSEPEPDISVTRGSEDDFSTGHPETAELVIEVSVSSAALDRENAALYAEAGVKEYWIVLGGERAVEIYSEPDPALGCYRRKRMAGQQEEILCQSVPGIRISVANLFPS
jgi:Uma2 family endonuclease